MAMAKIHWGDIIRPEIHRKDNGEESKAKRWSSLEIVVVYRDVTGTSAY